MGLIAFLRKQARKILLQILSHGAVPSHVAFIMDGNRRYAKKKGMDTNGGHSEGFSTLRDVLELSMELGVKEVTVFAFAIENFQRSKKEVDGLMNLAVEKLNLMMEKNDIIDQLGICVRIAGNISLLPPNVQEIMEKAVEYSKNNTRAVLNICFAYNSHEEILHSIKAIAQKVQEGLLSPSDVNIEQLENHMYIKNPPDLLVRTSGEIRLSNFLLWQSSFSCLHFSKVLWPNYGLWDFMQSILYYQYMQYFKVSPP